MKAIYPLLCSLLLFTSHGAAALEPGPGVATKPLMTATQSWDGRPIAYPQGIPEVTALMIEIAPGAQTGWHYHPVPSFAYILDGTLELTLDDGRVKRFKTGDAFAEVTNRLHNGRNPGPAPLRLIVFYTGISGTPVSVKQPPPPN